MLTCKQPRTKKKPNRQLQRKYPTIYNDLESNKLKTLDLSNTQTTDKLLKSLCSSISNASNLKKILLRGNRITDNGVMSLCAALKKSHIEILDLSGNRISPASFKYFRALKGENMSLRVLILGNNDIPVGVLKKKALQFFKLGVRMST